MKLFSKAWMTLLDSSTSHLDVDVHTMTREEKAFVVMCLYVSTDTPYRDRSWLYPLLPAVWHLPPHLVVKGTLRGLYHAREVRYVFDFEEPAHGLISAASLEGACAYGACLSQPAVLPLSTRVKTSRIRVMEVVDWASIHMPKLYQILVSTKGRYPVHDRILSEREVLVKYVAGLILIPGRMELPPLRKRPPNLRPKQGVKRSQNRNNQVLQKYNT